MNYQTFLPHPDLAASVKCYWTLEVPAGMEAPKQRIVPDGCIELFFILGEDVKRYTGEETFIIQPREMVLGQITEPFFIQPIGRVETFAVRFYPYGFANFVKTPIQDLANKETPLASLFVEKEAAELAHEVVNAKTTKNRIAVIERFLLRLMHRASTIDHIVKSTVDTLLNAKGSPSISALLNDQKSTRRSLERKFQKQAGISPKQLSKIIRLQAALNMLLNEQPESLTKVAYENKYYDQAHFIKDFKEFTGTNPKDYLKDQSLLLSSLFYSED